ncbi:DUF3566 domain-containing protein [Tomitella gaofuii]|uniref:DUF3566 domain-containing protein n=1 Tax=Tomitella gaofuii TaxID=2760083 RepID=UPI0015FB032C|nr:DUF3566 domain-containing protein [Tomitella gaofuii]
MSPDKTPASRPGSGGKPEQPRTATTDPGQGQDPAQRVRAEEAERMRERVHQREMSDEQDKSGQGAGSPDTSPSAASKKATGSGSGAGDPAAQGAAERSATEPGMAAQSADAPRRGRTIASASASVPRRAEQQPSQRPIISGTAAAKLLGKEPAEAGSAGGGPKTTTAAGAGKGAGAPAAKPGGGIDGPTSHIDRSSLAATEMPDLGKVRHPAPVDAKLEPEPHQRTAVTVGKRRGRGPLRASMQLRSIDPWSALKVSLVVSVALFLVWMVAVAIIYVVLDGMGVWDRLNSGVSDIISTEESSSALVGPGQVFGVAAILGIINIVLMTALSTLGAFIYNMSSEMVGGVEVTLADRD